MKEGGGGFCSYKVGYAGGERAAGELGGVKVRVCQGVSDIAGVSANVKDAGKRARYVLWRESIRRRDKL